MSPYGHWRRRVVHWISAYKARKMLPTVKYVHLLHNDKFAKPFVDFLNRNFPTTEHLVLCQRTANHPFPIGPNVLEVRKFFKGINLDRPNIDKIICHSLFINEIVDYLYTHPKLLREKAYWLIYGGDLYDAPRDEKNDFVRKNFKGFLATYDASVLKEKYGAKNIRVVTIPWNMEYAMLNKVLTPNKQYIQIQINNSCAKSTLEMLEYISRFSNENIRIVTIASYGDLQFKEQIDLRGHELFGDKYQSVSKMMSPKEYIQHLASNDILILNQDRQQGCGNAITSFYLGVKVFIKSTTTPYQTYRHTGIAVYDALKIKAMTFSEFIDKSGLSQNKSLAERLYNEKHWALHWQNALEN